MRILLLNPPFLAKNKLFMKELGRCGSTATANQLWPQTGLAYLAAMVEKKNDVKIIDAMVERYGIKDITRQINEFRPEIVVIHTTTPTFKNDCAVLDILKKNIPGLKIGFVGTHVSNAIKESIENSNADFIIINEPENTFKELIDNLGKSWDNIDGLAYKKNNEIKINRLRDLKDNLDSLPFPARHLLPNKKYRMLLTNNEPFATVVSSRGCPHRCIYCRVGNPWGKRFRKRSVSNVIDEIREIKIKFGIRNIVFMADTFTLDKKWTMDFCDQIIKSNLDIKWMCNSRVDTLDEEMCLKMKKAGCSMISFGVESGSQDVLNKANKNIDIKKAEYALNVAKKAGIKVFAYFIIGLPGETLETIRQTISFAIKLDPDYVNFHIATPHPGTKLHDYAQTNGWIIDRDFEHYDQSGNYAVMRNETLSPEQILLSQKKAMRQFYFRPKYIGKKLAGIRSPKELVDLSRIGLNFLFS